MLLNATTNRKQCSHCKKEKWPDMFHFYAYSEDRLFPQCKECVAARKREKYKADKEAEELLPGGKAKRESIARQKAIRELQLSEKEKEKIREAEHKAKIKKNREGEKVAKELAAETTRLAKQKEIESARLARLLVTPTRPKLSIEERFWGKADQRGDDECWLWKSTTNIDGYGRTTETPSKYLLRKCSAHRRAWEYINGPIPEGMFVLHRCDVRNCVNPAHLYLGTHQDNMNDMKRRGRHGYKNHPAPKALPVRD